MKTITEIIRTGCQNSRTGSWIFNDPERTLFKAVQKSGKVGWSESFPGLNCTACEVEVKDKSTFTYFRLMLCWDAEERMTQVRVISTRTQNQTTWTEFDYATPSEIQNHIPKLLKNVL